MTNLQKEAEMRQKLLQLFKEAVSSVHPSELIKSKVQVNIAKSEIRIVNEVFCADSKFHVIGFGKAVQSMADELVKILNSRIVSGVLSIPVTTPKISLPNFQIFGGAENNLPDKNSLSATDEIIRKISSTPKDDVIIVLTSGGGSSLLCKPVPEISLEDKLLTTKLLVNSGADISELNTVRKCLSLVKGGGLGQLLKNHRAVNLIMSDVIGDPLDVIASGPTIKSTSTPEDALDIIKKYKLDLKVPRHVVEAIRKRNQQYECDVKNLVIGSNQTALEAMLKSPAVGKKLIVSSRVEGLVRQVAPMYVDLAKGVVSLLATKNLPEFYDTMRLWIRNNSQLQINPDLVNVLSAVCQENTKDIFLFFGGETTVEIKGPGKGGRNQELALLFSQLLSTAVDENPAMFSNWEVTLMCAGTDGIDGPTDAAGAYGCLDVVKEAKKAGLNADNFVVNNDSYNFFSQVGSGRFHIKTGHTGTNVMDIHILAVSRK